jgi:2'-5' RNA ligase
MKKRKEILMEQQTHYFFAVKIPEDTKLIMQDHIEKLKERIPFSRWVHYLDLHITLAFLGAAQREKLIAAENNVKQALEGSKAFTLKITNLGCFGSKDSPRVLWAASEESSELNTIRKTVYSACERAGFQLETRPFRPHITLARKWKGNVPFQNELLCLWQELQPEPLIINASEVALYQTHLDQTPKYEALKIYRLQT